MAPSTTDERPAVPPLAVAHAQTSDGLKSARISMHTPRSCKHTPRPASTFESGGPLGEPFLSSHRSGVYYNMKAQIPDTCFATQDAQIHLPAAFAVLRNLLEPEAAELISEQLISGPAKNAAEPEVRTFNKSMIAFRRRFPALVDGVVAVKDAFGRFLELDASEISSVGLQDIRCVRYAAGQECPWHREDPRVHFSVAVLLSSPMADFEGGAMVVHAGECADDGDAMPVNLSQGDAIVLCAPRVDHAVQRVTEGSRVVCMFEFGFEREGEDY